MNLSARKLICVFFVFFVFCLAYPKRSLAQTPISNTPVPEPYVSCPNTGKPEWHSLRPYQASPCHVPIENQEQALLCGKDFIVQDTFTVFIPNPYCICPDCPPGCTGIVMCDCAIPREFEISLNAFDSRLPIAGNTELIPPGKTAGVGVNEKRLSEWEKKLPPDPEKYDDLRRYLIDYKEWRGKFCLTTPLQILGIRIPNISICFENPLNPNFWAKLFPYIPYSSTEDRIGKTKAEEMETVRANFTVVNLTTNWKDKLDDPRNKKTEKSEGVLYFPHMEENVELATLLQSTFVAKENLKDEKAQEIKTEDIEAVQKANEKECIILDVRSNPGDQLFGEQIDEKAKKSEGAPAANVSYIAVFKCPALCVCLAFDPITGGCAVCTQVGKCTKTGVFSSDIGTFTPLADELWSKTVAGNSSFFRRIFPKIGENSPFAKIKDIPAVSKVDYVVTPGKNSQGVTGEAGLTTQDPELYFPHFGGMYDYFLLAVQSMLRPKGFPGQPAGLQPDQPITEVDRVNEYLSWYLNGTLFRAEGDPLSDDDPEDIKRLIDLSGPLNKLLPQWIQWRNKVDSDVLTSQRPERQRTGRVDEVQRQKEQKEDKRHNQIVACTFGLKIPGWIPIFGGQEILAFPIACSEKELASIGQVPSGISPTPTPPPGTGDCPRSSIPNMPVNSSCKLSWNKIGSADIPPLMKKVFEAAGAKYNVPPDLIAGIMFAEGGFEPRIFEQNCYVDPDANYTDKNIENAILCEFKNCDPNDYHSPCNYNSNQGAFCAPTGAYGPYQQCPNNYNPCNFYDATMNAAEKLSRDRFGMPIQYFKDRKETPSCLGVSYNLGSTSTGYSCSENSWSCRDVITAIRFEAGSCIPGHFTNVLNILGKCP